MLLEKLGLRGLKQFSFHAGFEDRMISDQADLEATALVLYEAGESKLAGQVWNRARTRRQRGNGNREPTRCLRSDTPDRTSILLRERH